jgi:hypothetical protein
MGYYKTCITDEKCMWHTDSNDFCSLIEKINLCLIREDNVLYEIELTRCDIVDDANDKNSLFDVANIVPVDYFRAEINFVPNDENAQIKFSFLLFDEIRTLYIKSYAVHDNIPFWNIFWFNTELFHEICHPVLK